MAACNLFSGSIFVGFLSSVFCSNTGTCDWSSGVLLFLLCCCMGLLILVSWRILCSVLICRRSFNCFTNVPSVSSSDVDGFWVFSIINVFKSKSFTRLFVSGVFADI